MTLVKTNNGFLGVDPSTPFYTGILGMNTLLSNNIYLDNYTFSTADTNTHVYPSFIQAGDMLIAATTDQGSDVGTFPAGWTLVANGSGSNPRMKVHYKLADGTETGSFNVSADSNIVALFKSSRIINYDTAGALSTDSTTPVTATMTTTQSGILICVISSNSADFTITDTDGMTLAINETTIGQPEIKILTQISINNTLYTKNIGATGISNTNTVLLNIYV